MVTSNNNNNAILSRNDSGAPHSAHTTQAPPPQTALLLHRFVHEIDGGDNGRAIRKRRPAKQNGDSHNLTPQSAPSHNTFMLRTVHNGSVAAAQDAQPT
ncbi:unnamed protein product [Macrosiphum euphorbiae]|uniref:Uncharacterized protein n=1 Tax=Macrosiphum euphorbiae TaxID=13131 RepID=A0AAV0WR83_9HEMI|nr:unnamed protein product [Macrosiphum euphorbiae]